MSTTLKTKVESLSNQSLSVPASLPTSPKGTSCRGEKPLLKPKTELAKGRSKQCSGDQCPCHKLKPLLLTSKLAIATTNPVKLAAPDRHICACRGPRPLLLVNRMKEKHEVGSISRDGEDGVVLTFK